MVGTVRDDGGDCYGLVRRVMAMSLTRSSLVVGSWFLNTKGAWLLPLSDGLERNMGGKKERARDGGRKENNNRW